MIVEINNLEGIESAKIDLSKKLTVLTGEHNTCITDVLSIVYALTSKQSFIPKLLPENLLASLIVEGVPITRSFIFPVERNSIFIFNRNQFLKGILLSERIKEPLDSINELVDFTLSSEALYHQNIRDNLKIIEDAWGVKKNNCKYCKYSELAEKLEDELLVGKFSFSSEGEVRFTTSRDGVQTREMPIYACGDNIKTLASLTIYLKYLSEKNDLVIIDEPEENLHPYAQIILARFFAQLINAGFRLLISTHSDYILRELNNLIMLSTTSPDVNSIKEEYGYLENEKISPSDVKAYHFENKSKVGVVVKPLKVTECGFGVPSIDNILQDLNSTSEDLYYAIKYPEQYEGSE